ncbi:hypothetical protein ASF61_20595 [Duganella sp. Leaf126]|uniref:hypothetical protein n=1 Tax=Duganella sp. Leaf126 TaxID=1736266 RepID=UPI0007001136|nr:hypothetical protein [Duganella sp. Leaf126]KQQ45355.1 hypothetical protein ASF61_20595 [Duganella sp. Leaf126]
MLTRRQVLVASAASAASITLPAAAANLPAPTADTLRFVFSRPLDNPRTQWLIRVYTQVTAELGLGFAFIEVPPKRATAMVLHGDADGELGRTFEYQLLYPTLVRVPEPNNAVRFAAYATRPGLRFDSWQALRAGGMRCEYRLGIVELEHMLMRELPATRVSAINAISQGVKKLQLGRTDLYFDVEEAVSDYLYFLGPEQRQALGAMRQVGVVLTTTGHAYLNSTRAALAPQLAATLARLKRQGDVQRHLLAALAAYKARL